MAENLNILFITADQWRGDTLGAAGHPCVKTPNLDRLAAEGTLFLRHYSQAAPCSPGRASLYTGTYLKNHRVVMNGTPLSKHLTNVALEARRGGYDPALFGYTDMAPDPDHHAEGDPALSSYEGVLPGMKAVLDLSDNQLAWIADLTRNGYEVPWRGYEVFRPAADTPRPEGALPSSLPAFYDAEHSNTALVAREAIKYIDLRGARPWFAHLSFFAVHPPWLAPAPYHELYSEAEAPPPVRAESLEAQSGDHPWLYYNLRNQQGTGPWLGLSAEERCSFSEAEVRQIRATYYGLVSELDAQIGRLIDHLKEKGLYDSTLIVVTSDHAEQLGDQWSFGKQTAFDSSYHVPLIIRDPRAAADKARGRKVTRFTENVDVMPTILDWIGLEVPAQCDGSSLLPWCHGESPPVWRDEAHWEFDFRNIYTRLNESALGLTSDQCNLAVLRGERYKYVHFPTLPPLFYDLEEDPQEARNLAQEPDYRGLVLDYAQRMLSWRMLHESRARTHQMVTPEGLHTANLPRC